MSPALGRLSRPLRIGFASAGIIHVAAYLLMRNNVSPKAAAFMAYGLAAAAFMALLASHAPDQKNWFSPWHQRAAALVVGVGACDCMLLPMAQDWMGTFAVTAIMAATVCYGNVFWLHAVAGKPVRLSEQQQRLRDYAPAVFLFFSIAAMLCRTVPSLFGSGEMWAEAATNYFWHARYDDLLTNLTTLDAGYIPLAARLCAMAIHATHLSPHLIPYAYQAWTLLFISTCLAYFALPRWRCLVQSDLARCMICVALACHPDFDLKAFINFPYYGAIPLLLHLSVLMQNQFGKQAPPDASSSGIPAWRVVGLSVFTAVFCISKPHFVAFAPALVLLAILGVRRRRLAVVAPACAGLLVIGIQLLVLVQSRAGDSHSVRLEPKVLARWMAQLSFTIPAINLGGKPMWIPSMANHPLSSYMVLCGLVAAGFAGYQLWRGDRQGMAGIAVVGVSVFAAALALSVVVFTPVYQAVWQANNFETFALRWFFMPCLAMFLVLGIVVAKNRVNQHVPWLLGAFLLGSFPFGFGAWPADAAWAKVGHSSWQLLAPKVFGPDGDKGCIPVDPSPFTFQVNCEPLLAISPGVNAGGYVALSQEVVLAAPKEALGWSVDSFSIMLDRPPPYNSQPDTLLVTAKALNQNGHLLATTQGHSKPGSLSVIFAFSPAPKGVAAIALTPEKPGSLNLLSRTVDRLGPIWAWFGRRLDGMSVAEG